MKALKVLGMLVLAVMVLFVLIANFSAVATSYECPGQFVQGANTTPGTIFFRLERYRPWVGLWSDSDGNLRVEVPNEWLAYYSDVVEVGDQLQIRGDGKPAGNFSTLSKAFALSTHRGFFDGTCRQIAN